MPYDYLLTCVVRLVTTDYTVLWRNQGQCDLDLFHVVPAPYKISDGLPASCPRVALGSISIPGLLCDVCHVFVRIVVRVARDHGFFCQCLRNALLYQFPYHSPGTIRSQPATGELLRIALIVDEVHGPYLFHDLFPGRCVDMQSVEAVLQFFFRARLVGEMAENTLECPVVDIFLQQGQAIIQGEYDTLSKAVCRYNINVQSKSEGIIQEN